MNIRLVIFIISLSILTVFSSENIDTALSHAKLPNNYKIEVLTEINNPRSLSYSPNNVLFVGNAQKSDSVRAIVLDDDFTVKKIVEVTEPLFNPNGVAYHKGDLFVATPHQIYLYKEIDKAIENGEKATGVPFGDPLPPNPAGYHDRRYIIVDKEDRVYVTIGSPCNIPDKANMSQCTEHNFGTILRMDINGKNRTVIARGIRSSVGLAIHPETNDLYFTDNGRDNWGNDRPYDELNVVNSINQHYGFPYCYDEGDPDPEFNPDKNCTGYVPCLQKLDPHSAPLGMKFYDGSFPNMKNKLFIAQHGSWNRYPPSGYKVSVYDPKENKLSEFLTGFLPSNPISCNTDDECSGIAYCSKETGEGSGYCTGFGRPVDIEVMPDGSLLVSDDTVGVIYRIYFYTLPIYVYILIVAGMIGIVGIIVAISICIGTRMKKRNYVQSI